MDEAYLNVGKIVNTHGIRGELKVLPTTDFPDIRFAEDSELVIECPATGRRQTVRVERARRHRSTYIVKFKGLDHIGDAVAIARRARPKAVVGIFELCHWLERKGVENTRPMNKGGSQRVEGLRVTMVHADHSCGILDGDQIVYGGEAVGYILEVEDGRRLYHAGDTALFGDMRLIGELYRPDLAMLPIGDLFTMSPEEAAQAIRLLGVKRVIPMHYGTFPVLTGTPERLKELTRDLPDLEIIVLRPGQSLVYGATLTYA